MKKYAHTRGNKNFSAVLLCLIVLVFSDWWKGSVSALEDESLQGWIRICTQTRAHYEAMAKNCPSGIFLKEPMIPGCVCMQGTWILHPTLCDHSAYVFYGEDEQEQCYQVDFNVSTFIYLGDPLDIRKSRTYVAPDSLTVFHEITNGTTTPLIEFHRPSIVAIHPVKNILATENGKKRPVCFSKSEYVPKEVKVKAHIWNGARGPTTYKLVDSCEGMNAGGYDDLIGTFDHFFYRSNKAVPMPYALCSSTCVQGVQVSAVTSSTTESTFWSHRLKSNSTHVRSSGIAKRRKRLAVHDEDGRVSDTRNGSGPLESSMHKRAKRYKTRETVETTWDGLAFCMKSYWDPTLKFEMLTTEEKLCYPERNMWQPGSEIKSTQK